ncbi:chemotaxis protein CheB [Streptomyces sclerotialus]|uniref:chemotaxis protein CheB n=1 Tax=Streptomyces sclerotialus TaxID=1957 RepID=UPI0004C94AD0
MTADAPAPDHAQSAPDHFAIVAVACSAGGIRALSMFLQRLGSDLPVPVLIVQHLDPRHETVLAELLARRSGLTVELAKDNDQVQAGTVHIAPPDHHLLVSTEGVLTLSRSAPVHFVRPAADRLFESVATAYGPRAIVCVLTGTGRDGSQGAVAVKSHGGTVIAQDPHTAEFSGMPEAAVDTGQADFVLPLEEIATVVRGLVETKRQ